MHVGQPKIAASVAVGEPLVVEAQQVQHRRVQIMHARRILHGLEAELVGGAVGYAAPDAAAGHPYAEAVVVVIAAKLRGAVAVQFHRGRAAEFTAPDDERIIFFRNDYDLIFTF